MTDRDVLRAALEAQVQRAIPVLLGGDLPDIIEDTGGWGLCHHASKALVEHVGRGVLFAMSIQTGFCWFEAVDETLRSRRLRLTQVFPAFVARYEGHLDIGHYVAVIDGHFVDLTARQFCRALPYPLIHPIDAQHTYGAYDK